MATFALLFSHPKIKSIVDRTKLLLLLPFSVTHTHNYVINSPNVQYYTIPIGIVVGQAIIIKTAGERADTPQWSKLGIHIYGYSEIDIVYSIAALMSVFSSISINNSCSNQ